MRHAAGLSTVRLATGPKRSPPGHLLGAEKINFLIRDIDDATRAAAPWRARFVVRDHAWGRLPPAGSTSCRVQSPAAPTPPLPGRP